VYFKKCADEDKDHNSPALSHFSSVRCFQSPIQILEEDTTTIITHLFHMSTLKVKLEQRNKGKYAGATRDAYFWKFNPTTALPYLMKWFKFNDENYLKHIG
jgi:hypothetical protein